MPNILPNYILTESSKGKKKLEKYSYRVTLAHCSKPETRPPIGYISTVTRARRILDKIMSESDRLTCFSAQIGNNSMKVDFEYLLGLFTEIKTF